MLLSASVFVFSGCVRTGPPGPTGPQGPMGNANVVGSAPFTVSSWTKDGNLLRADFNSPDITTDIADYGVVSVFKEYDANVWTPLPDILGQTSTVFEFFSGGFTIYIQNADGSLPAIPAATRYRMVAISSSYRQAYPNTNWKNYDEVMNVLSRPLGTVQNTSSN